MKTLTIEDLAKIVKLQQDVAIGASSFAKLKTLICEQTQELTHAGGTVVEMVDGDEMVYTAACGTLAGTVGLRLKRATSLSGLSVATGKLLYCEDSEVDPRVDRVACRKVGARSMICVPLIYQNQPIGVLKVVSPQEKQFSDKEIRILELCAGLLSAKIAQAEDHKKLEESERKFRSIIENASDGILVSKNGLVIEANSAFCKLFGYSVDDVKGHSAYKFQDSKYREDSKDKINNHFEQAYESKGVRADGTSFDIEVSGRTLLVNDEYIRMTVVRDISEKKTTLKNLQDSEQKSREAHQAKSHFLANMSHEVRTPLNGILGMTNLLEETSLDQTQKNYVDILRNSANSLLTIVNDILDFSKIEARKLVIETITFKLPQRIFEVTNILSYTASLKGIQLHSKIDDDVPELVKGDPTRIKQILINLVSNGIKFTNQGYVEIHVSKKNDKIRFEIHDTGIGIPENFQNNLFDAFTQVDSSTTRKFGGTGLGLSISKELVAAMQGEIGVFSEEGKGSTFWFEIALPESSEIEGFKIDDQLASTHSRPLKVLLVEDNAVNSLIAKKMLEKLSHLPVMAVNGRDALEKLSSESFDVILMDCQMPEMDGFEATKAIRASNKSWKDIPIIAMTAHAMSGDREKCIAAGMNDYLSKPMNLQSLSQTLSQYS